MCENNSVQSCHCPSYIPRDFSWKFSRIFPVSSFLLTLWVAEWKKVWSTLHKFWHYNWDCILEKSCKQAGAELCQAQSKLRLVFHVPSLQLSQTTTYGGKPAPIWILLLQPQQQHNVIQPQHSWWVGHENDFANPTHPPPTQTFQALLDELESWNLAQTLTRPIWLR